MDFKPDQIIMIKYLYVKDTNCQIRNGKDFIRYFITSNIKTDTHLNEITQEYIFFDNKTEAITKVNDFFEVLEDLNRIISVTKYPDEKPKVKFILKEPGKEECEFTEFYNLFYEYYTANFEIIDQKKFDRFVKQGYIHDMKYLYLQSLKKRFSFIDIIMILLAIIGIIVTFYFGLKQIQ